MYLTCACLLQQFNNLAAGSAANDGVIDHNNGFAFYNAANRVQLQAYCISTLLLRRLNKSTAYITVFGKAFQEGNAGLHSIADCCRSAAANQGHTGTIMDAARAAGAGGGTVIHAKGTGMEGAAQFLGVELVNEKELVLIVARTPEKNRIMKAIMDGAGPKAGAIVFSLPVTDTAGLRLLEDEEPVQETSAQ